MEPPTRMRNFTITTPPIEDICKRGKKQTPKSTNPTNKGDTNEPLSKAQSKYKTNHEYKGLMRPRGDVLLHPAGPTLLEYATKGCPVDCGPQWSRERIEKAIADGPSKSAQDPEAARCCREEALQKVKEGHCRLVKWDDIKNDLPENLKVSPIAAIPHKSRKYRMILNLAYRLRILKERLKSVNDSTNKLAPQHAMFELGNVIPRIIWAMARAPNTGVPILFSKIDLKDGYWRMVVDEDEAWNFAYVLPRENDNEPIMLVIPNALQMGWTESPPFFCAGTETARDVADKYWQESQANYIEEDLYMKPHPNEATVMNIDWNKIPSKGKAQLLKEKMEGILDEDTKLFYLLECFVDDFISLIQCTDKRQLTEMTRCVLHAITSVFPPPELTNSVMGPAISPKKLEEEGAWEVRKINLGWLLDGIDRTIQLPSEKCDKLIELLKSKLKKGSKISVKDLESLQGKLQFASIGIPLGKPLLGPVDQTLARAKAQPNIKYIKVKDELDNYSRNWRAILKLMRSRPSHVKELIMQEENAYRGLVDASKWGCGGVWFSGTQRLAPFVWYIKWPNKIKELLCTAENKRGPITISDLELMGIFLQWLALEMAVGKSNLKHHSPAIWCDNISAVAWTRKLRSSTSLKAGGILRAFATRLHSCEASLLAVDHISGTFNIMSDLASREHSTNNFEFLKHFSTSFPPPQQNSWTLFQFSNDLTSRIYSQLLMTTSKTASFRRLGKKGCAFSALGNSGLEKISGTYPLTCTNSHETNNLTPWLPGEDMLKKETFQIEKAMYNPKRSRWHLGPSQRPVSWTENETPWITRKDNIQRRLVKFWKPTDEKTNLQHPN